MQLRLIRWQTWIISICLHKTAEEALREDGIEESVISGGLPDYPGSPPAVCQENKGTRRTERSRQTDAEKREIPWTAWKARHVKEICRES